MKNTSGQVLVGTITTNRKGMGFMKNPDDIENDFVIEEGNLNGALNKDTVEITFLKDLFAKVTKVVTRGRETYVCTIEQGKDSLIAIPEDKKAYVPFLLSAEDMTKVAIGDKVYVKLGEWSDLKKYPPAALVKVIGKKGNNNAEMESIVLEKGFEIGFPDAVEAEAGKIEQDKQHDMENEIKVRKDFRATLTCTIDPFDAKDFDDAISFKDLGNETYEIGVHIADVSHYVIPGTALDTEALKRGCSIYLVDRTIPMLPEVLSNDVCSLNSHEDKLTFSAWFVINTKGEILERHFGKTIINSDHRFTYEDAQELLNAGKGQYFAELNTLKTYRSVQKGTTRYSQARRGIHASCKPRSGKVYLRCNT